MRPNLVKSFSQKRTFIELEDGFKTGAAWAKRKEKEIEGGLIGLIKEMVTSVNTVTGSISASARTSAAMPASAASAPARPAAASTQISDNRFDMLVVTEVQEIRDLQKTASADLLDIREKQQEILLLLSDLRSNQGEGGVVSIHTL